MKPKISCIAIDIEVGWPCPFISIRRGENKAENWRNYNRVKPKSFRRILLAAFSIAWPLVAHESAGSENNV